MKILVTSDWHLDYWSEEGRPPTIPSYLDGLDALIIAGDLADDPLRNWPLYLRWLGRHIDPAKVYVLPGNHDYYGHRLDGDDALRALVEAAGMRFVQKQVLMFEEVRFLCCTLWSDFGLFGTRDHSMVAARWMEDFSRIHRDAQGEVVMPQDTLAAHEDQLAWLTRAISQPHDGRTVIVTHHQPSPGISGPPSELSPFFISDLDPWIMEHQADLWLCGHSHRRLQGRVRETLIRDISFGYPFEVAPDKEASLLLRGLIDTDAPGLLVH